MNGAKEPEDGDGPSAGARGAAASEDGTAASEGETAASEGETRLDEREATGGDSDEPGVVRRTIDTGLAVYRLSQETQISFLAAAIAYYAFVSMVPLVVLGVVVATTLGGDALADQVVAAAGNVLEPAGEDLLRTAVTARTGVGGVSAVGLVVLLWGALKAFRALDLAFSLVYGTQPATSVVASFVDAIVGLSAVGAGLVAMIVVGGAVALLPGQVPPGLGAVVLFLTLFVVFLPLYYLFPDADIAVREVPTGAAFAALSWTVLGSVFQLYAAYASGASVYGLLGGVLLALTWLYLGAFVLLLGAAVNAVRSGNTPAAAGNTPPVDQ